MNRQKHLGTESLANGKSTLLPSSTDLVTFYSTVIREAMPTQTLNEVAPLVSVPLVYNAVCNSVYIARNDTVTDELY